MASEQEQSNEWSDLQAEIYGLFSPAAPVSRQALFAGRVAQMRELIDVISETGQHAVIYGERGVGKTSLAATMTEMLESRKRIAVRANCDAVDNFGTIWHKALAEVKLRHQIRGAGFAPEVQHAISTAARLLPKPAEVTPNDVRVVLTALGEGAVGPVVFFDEFDRLTDAKTKSLLADTIKTLSDQLVFATLVFVGVADTVDQLIAEHQSVERALIQIPMPRMSTVELAEIVRRVESIDMSIDPDAVDRITRLSQGLPHYTHRLTQAAAIDATDNERREIGVGDVQAAVRVAISKTQESVSSAYQRATFSPRTTLYREVLLACALLQGDELGQFTAGDVRAPMSAIMGKPYDIPAFAAHLKDMSSAKRGPVLERRGETRRFRYRFINPLLQPYVVMRGLDDGLVTTEILRRFVPG